MRRMFSLFFLLPCYIFAQTQVVVTARDENKVLIYNANPFALEATIEDPSFYTIYGVAISKDGKLAFVANNGSDLAPGHTVSVIDLATRKVIKVIEVGPQPFGLAVSLDGSSLYVTNQNTDQPYGSISIIDIQTLKVTDTIQNAGKNPTAMAFTPDGRYLYITNNTSLVPAVYGYVTVVDTITKQVVDTIEGQINGHPVSIVIGKDGYCYVGGLDLTYLNVIRTPNNEVLPFVSLVNDFIDGLALTPAGGKLYISEGSDNLIEIMDTSTKDIVDSIAITSNGLKGQIAIEPEGKYAFLANLVTGLIRIDLEDPTTQDLSPAEDYGLFGVAITPGVLNLNVNPISNRFVAQSVIQTTISWTHDLSITPDTYYLYRDGQLLKIFHAGDQLSYFDSNLIANHSYRYTVVAEKNKLQIALATQLIQTPSP